jgi:glutamine synthetase
MITLSDEEIADVVANLRDQGVTALVGTFLDNGGVARAKQVPLERIAAFHRNGLGCSYSWATFAPDSHLPLTPYFSVVGDMRLKVDLRAVRVLGDGLAWAPINIFNPDGSPLAHCARGALARQVALLGADGYAARAAYEVEFTAFDAVTGEPDIGVAYGLRAMMENEAFYADIAAGLRTAGIAMEQLHAEAGVGQIELSTPPLDPVAAADVLVVTRLILSRVARRHAKRVSFAPQSIAKGLGNGAHVHFSLTKDGVPIFSGGEQARELREEGAHAIGGLLQGLPDALGVLTPSLLSATRLQPGMWSGAYVCWGCENREAAVRLCQATLGNPYGANVEIKVTDHSANPYAALAVILGLAHRGITSKASLPAEAPVDPSSLRGTKDEIATFNTDQAANLAATCASPVMREILSDHMIEAINAVRSYEVTVSATKSYEEIIEIFRFAWSS